MRDCELVEVVGLLCEVFLETCHPTLEGGPFLDHQLEAIL